MDKKSFVLLLIVGCFLLSTEAGRKGRKHKKTKVPLKKCEAPIWNMKVKDNWILPILGESEWTFKLTIDGLDSEGRYMPGKKHKVTITSRTSKNKIQGAFITLDRNSSIPEVEGSNCGLGAFVGKEKTQARKATPSSGCFEPAIYEADADKGRKRVNARWVAPTCGEVIMRATVKNENTLYYDDGDEDVQYEKLTKYLNPSVGH